MSLQNIINTSLSGLATNQSALRATSNNIANVNTAGYSRLEVSQAANVLQGETAGVKIDGIQRVVDEFMETALRNAGTNTAEYRVQREYHDRLQGILGNPDSASSLSSRIDQVFGSVADLALNPSDVLRRTSTLTEFDSFLDQLSVLQSQLQDLRADTSLAMVDNVDQINAKLQTIAELNPLIARQLNVGGETGGLQNQMSNALEELAELVDINVVGQTNGQVYVYTNSGQPLVDSSLYQMSYETPGVSSASTFFPDVEIARVNSETLAVEGTPRAITSDLRSGSLKGLIDLRDDQFVALSTTLGELGARFADEVNAIHNAYSAVPAQSQLEGKQTFVDGGHTPGFTGIVTFAVTDNSGTIINETTVDFDAAPPATMNALITQVNTGLSGDATLTLLDGQLTYTSASPTNGVVIADDPTTPSDRGGRGFSHFFGMNDLIVTDVAGVYETGVVSSDDHNIASGTMNFTVRDMSGKEVSTVTVDSSTTTTFDDMVTELNSVSGMGAYFAFSFSGDGELQWSANATNEGYYFDITTDSTELASTGLSFGQAFGLAPSLRAQAVADIQVDELILGDPSLMALSAYDTTAGIGGTGITAGDQRGALALQDLETALVDFNEAGEIKGSNLTLTQYVARFLGNAGLMAARAESLEADNAALHTELFQRVSDVSGVNLDEELANLIVYQNAYNAAARILSSVQELYDSLLNAV